MANTGEIVNSHLTHFICHTSHIRDQQWTDARWSACIPGKLNLYFFRVRVPPIQYIVPKESRCSPYNRPDRCESEMIVGGRLVINLPRQCINHISAAICNLRNASVFNLSSHIPVITRWKFH